jgi:hypothetical protein
LSPSYSEGARYVAAFLVFETHLISLEEIQPAGVFDPSQLLSLNCFVLGDERRRAFTVKILKTGNVSILKGLIKGKKASRLKDIDASDLDLWQVSFPVDDLETKLGDLNLCNHPELSPPGKTITAFFKAVADDCLHVLVKVPGVEVQQVVTPISTQLLSLNCLVHGDNPDWMLAVKVLKTTSVSILKGLIKREKAFCLKDIDASDLDLWNVSRTVTSDRKMLTSTTVSSYYRRETTGF